LWLIKVWFSASTLVVKIATFAKPENVRAHAKNPPHKWHIWFCPDTQADPSAKPKEPFFANAPTDKTTIFQTLFILKNDIIEI
jgi:hypothetical protein